VFNQRIFNAEFRHFSAAAVRQSLGHERWEQPNPMYVVMMFERVDGQRFVANLPKPPELNGWTVNQFLDTQGGVHTVVSLIFCGIVRWVDGRWCILIGRGRRPLRVPLIREADLGLIPSTISLQALPVHVESYVREHWGRIIGFQLFPAYSITSAAPAARY
jgi:hypothetical protein